MTLQSPCSFQSGTLCQKGLISFVGCKYFRVVTVTHFLFPVTPLCRQGISGYLLEQLQSFISWQSGLASFATGAVNCLPAAEKNTILSQCCYDICRCLITYSFPRMILVGFMESVYQAAISSY